MNIKYVITLLFFWSTWNVFSQRVSQKIGTNPTIIAPSAVVEIESTTKGFLPPRMTFVQRNAINSPATGLVVYCTDCGFNGELQVFNGSTWTNFSGSSASGTMTTNVPTSNGGTLIFMAHNLGADTTADPLVPSWRINGAYFQWGKKPLNTNEDNYRTKSNNGPEGFAAAPTGPGPTEANSSLVASWSSTSAADGAWNINESSPIKTVNDPCPVGYRVPTRNEWVSIHSALPINTITNWSNVGTSWTESITNYTSGKMVNNRLYLPASGSRWSSNGTLEKRGSRGVYWSSTETTGGFSYSLSFTSFDASPLNIDGRRFALSIRCVAE